MQAKTRICPKCGGEFKKWIKKDGEWRNCSGRKFCFTCSPYGSRNTKTDPTRPSKPHTRNMPFKDWPKADKHTYLTQYYKRGQERKQKLVEQKGGGCKQCGYNKCLRCLTFHHREPELKQFSLTIREVGGMSWESVLVEAEKCDLLCLNCHMELEDKTGRSKYAD